MNELDAEHAQAIGALTAQVLGLAKQVEELAKDVKELTAIVNKSKGAIAICVLLGGCFGWLISLLWGQK